MTKTFADLPTYDNLPDKRKYWEWGEPGSIEEGLGKLNLLTPDVVAEASKEIQTGERAQLSWEMSQPDVPQFGRQKFEHNIHWILKPLNFDDTMNMNPQSGSQWDGFRHQGMPIDTGNMGIDEKTGGVKLNQMAEKQDADELTVFLGNTKPSEIEDRSNGRIGIHHWAKKGIVGRGVLIDYADWAESKGKVTTNFYPPHRITADDLKQIVKEKNIELKPGDILLVRSGFIKQWESLNLDQKHEIAAHWPPEFTGVEQSEDMLRFIWDNHFVAVAGDAPSFEKFFPDQNDTKIELHHYLLAGWGIPIGEMWYLEELSKICKKLNRYSFFLTSAPLNCFGGVASPPNAIAVF